MSITQYAPRSVCVVVPGRVQSQNAKVRFGNGHQHNSPKTVTYQDNVRQYAWLAAQAAGWTPPPCTRVIFTVWNTFIDADNACKLAMDSIKGVFILDDNRTCMREFSCAHKLDDQGPRLEIQVDEAEALVKPPKPKKGKV